MSLDGLWYCRACSAVVAGEQGRPPTKDGTEPWEPADCPTCGGSEGWGRAGP